MLKAFKYRIYPSAEQKAQIHQHFGCSRWIYNYALNKKMTAFQTEKKSLSRFDIQADIPNLKRSEDTAWLKEVNSQTLQASLENLDKAYTRFFKEFKIIQQIRHLPPLPRNCGFSKISCSVVQGVKWRASMSWGANLNYCL